MGGRHRRTHQWGRPCLDGPSARHHAMGDQCMQGDGPPRDTGEYDKSTLRRAVVAATASRDPQRFAGGWAGGPSLSDGADENAWPAGRTAARQVR